MKWVIRGYALVLLGYTGWRTYDFMLNQLPAGDFSSVLAILFLFCTEAGLALWHEISLKHTGTHEQQNASTGLTILDFLGSLGAGIADMILRQSFLQGYTIPPVLGYFLLYGLPVLVALNVAGVLYYERNDSETQLDRAKKALKFEIQRQALRELHDNQSQIAENMKKSIYGQLRDDVTGKIEQQYLKDHKQAAAQLPPPGPKVRSIFNLPSLARNGHKPNYNLEVPTVATERDPKNELGGKQ